jgi:hypothetical protein
MCPPIQARALRRMCGGECDGWKQTLLTTVPLENGFGPKDGSTVLQALCHDGQMEVRADMVHSTGTRQYCTQDVSKKQQFFSPIASVSHFITGGACAPVGRAALGDGRGGP